MRLHLLLFLACVAVVVVQRSSAPESRPARREYTRNRGGGGASGARSSHARTQARRRARTDGGTSSVHTDRQGRPRRGPTSRTDSTRRTSRTDSTRRTAIDVSIRHTYRADSTRQTSRAVSSRQRSRTDSNRQRSRADSSRQSTGGAGSVQRSDERWPNNCTRCAERQEIKRWRLDLIKSEILQKLRLEAPPNITSRNMPEILNETLYPYLQMDQAVSDQAFDGDDYHATKLKIVTIGQAPPPSLGINESHVCVFAFQTDVKKAEITSANLFVYIRPTPPSEASTWILIYKYFPATGRRDARRRVIARKKIFLDRSATGTYYNFDVKNVLLSWVNSDDEDLAIEVEAFDHNAHSLAVINPRLASEDRYKPFIEVRITNRTTRKKRMLGLECDDMSTEDRCCRYPLVVDFVDFNWDWVIAPKRYRANFCSGECGYVFFQKYPHTHIITQTKPNGGAGPCCNPTKVSPIPLLYFNDRYNVIHGTLPGMVVDRCGCS